MRAQRPYGLRPQFHYYYYYYYQTNFLNLNLSLFIFELNSLFVVHIFGKFGLLHYQLIGISTTLKKYLEDLLQSNLYGTNVFKKRQCLEPLLPCLILLFINFQEIKMILFTNNSGLLKNSIRLQKISNDNNCLTFTVQSQFPFGPQQNYLQ